ncbi:hypothetical protein PAMP_023185 [Pampus punctatissimus]
MITGYVSAEILKGSLATMERHIQRLENDIENFPKTDDQRDKSVEANLDV